MIENDNLDELYISPLPRSPTYRYKKTPPLSTLTSPLTDVLGKSWPRIAEKKKPWTGVLSGYIFHVKGNSVRYSGIHRRRVHGELKNRGER